MKPSQKHHHTLTLDIEDCYKYCVQDNHFNQNSPDNQPHLRRQGAYTLTRVLLSVYPSPAVTKFPANQLPHFSTYTKISIPASRRAAPSEAPPTPIQEQCPSNRRLAKDAVDVWRGARAGFPLRHRCDGGLLSGSTKTRGTGSTPS